MPVKVRYGLEVEKEMINFVPGIVPGIGMALNAFTEKGDKVMIQPPVYGPFSWLNTRNDRTLVTSPLKLVDGMFRMDMEAFRRDIKGCKVFILCNLLHLFLLILQMYLNFHIHILLQY